MDSSLSKTPGTSLHRQLFMALRDQVLRGEYSPGTMIPKEEDLGREFNVSRITVRRAVADLEAQGLLEKRHGRGTFVTDRIPLIRELATLSYLDMQRGSVSNTKTKVLEVKSMVPPRDIGRVLAIGKDDKAMHTLRLHSGKRPLLLSESWIVESRSTFITKKALQKQPMFELLLAAGVEYGPVVQELTAVAANAALARVLNVEMTAPLVKLTRVQYDSGRLPIHYQILHFTPERSRLVFEITPDVSPRISSGGIIHDV